MSGRFALFSCEAVPYARHVVSDANLSGADHRPILVTGMARSGTTWVGQMLEASDQVGYIGEPLNFEASFGVPRVGVSYWYPYFTEQNEDEVLEPLRALLRFEYDLLGHLLRARTRAEVVHVGRTWARFARSRGRRPLIKEPHAVFSAEWFAERLGSRVVITVRHPAAVVSSWKRLGWSFDFRHLLEQRSLVRDRLARFEREMEKATSEEFDLVDRAALLWKVIYSVAAEYRRRYPEFLVLRHEALSRTPLDEYADLFEALGLSFTPGVREAIAASTARGNPTQTDVDDPHATRLDSRANLENWRRRLTEDEIRRVRDVTEEIAAEFYADDEW